jgi:hypothetical protein
MGQVILTTDPDWIRAASSYTGHTELMENIFNALATNPGSCP